MAFSPISPRAAAPLRICAFSLCLAAPSALLAQAAAPPAQTTAPPTAAPIAPAPSPLSQIPGVRVRYYDVTGNTIAALRASIEAQRPKSPTTGVASPSSSNWQISARARTSTLKSRCKVTGATATLQADVVLPRLATTEGVPAPVLAEWQRYVASLEQQQADRLRRPYQRLAEVERAMMASTCDGANAAASRAIAQINAAPPPPPTPAAATPQQ